MRIDVLVTVLALSGTTEAFTAGGSTACRVTPPVRTEPAKDPNADPFGHGPWYINSDRTIWAGATQMREGRNKVLWIRPQGTELRVSGRRQDGKAPPLTARIPCCYPTGFQSTALTFASAGCWEIRATAGTSTLTFVTQVKAGRQPTGAAEQPVAPDERAPSSHPPARR
jgi:hypothetical protein